MITLVLPDIPEEDRLLEQARQGNRDAIAQIYESYFPPIYQFIRLRVDDNGLAEDLASEVFSKLLKALRGKTAPRHSLRGWLFQLARNELYHHYGKAQQFPVTSLDEWVPASSENDPEAEFLQVVSIERVRQALRTLEADQQEVLILRFAQALSLEATADIMGRSVAAVKALQARALDKLRRLLQREWVG